MSQNKTYKTNRDEKAFNILSCDDENNIKEFLWHLLSEEGHTVDFAKDGEEVFKKLGRTKYDLLILDVNISKMNGYEVSEKICRSIKNRPKILIFTGRDLKQEKTQFIRSNADDIIQKGAPIKYILRTVHDLLDKSVSDAAISAAASVANNFSQKQNASFNSEPKHDLDYCLNKISEIEKSTKKKMDVYEEFIRHMLLEKPHIKKIESDLKFLEKSLHKNHQIIYFLILIFIIVFIAAFF